MINKNAKEAPQGSQIEILAPWILHLCYHVNTAYKIDYTPIYRSARESTRALRQARMQARRNITCFPWKWNKRSDNFLKVTDRSPGVSYICSPPCMGTWGCRKNLSPYHLLAGSAFVLKRACGLKEWIGGEVTWMEYNADILTVVLWTTVQMCIHIPINLTDH